MSSLLLALSGFLNNLLSFHHRHHHKCIFVDSMQFRTNRKTPEIYFKINNEKESIRNCIKYPSINKTLFSLWIWYACISLFSLHFSLSLSFSFLLYFLTQSFSFTLLLCLSLFLSSSSSQLSYTLFSPIAIS